MTEGRSTFDNRTAEGGRICWVGVVIEVEPGKFMHTTIRAKVVHMDVTTEYADVGDGILAAYIPTARNVRLEIEGAIGAFEPTERPDWAAAPAGEIQAPPVAIGSDR